jgi:hypothetical protein
MSRLVLAGVSLLAAAVLVAGAAARERSAAVGPALCGKVTQFTYLLWPTGHPQIPAIGSPAYPPPHLEMYSGTILSNETVAAFISAQGGAFAKSCKAAKLGHASPLAHARTTTQTAEVTCTFARPPEHLITKAGGGTVLETIEPAKPGTTARPQIDAVFTIGPTGSKGQFDPKVCKQSEAPKPPPVMQFSFDGLAATFNGGSAGTWGVTFSGKSCGSDIHGPWTVTRTLTLNGAPVGPPGASTIDLTSGSASLQFLKTSDGNSVATAQFQLNPGPPPTVTLTMGLTGSFTAASPPAQAAVTVTPVPSC